MLRGIHKASSGWLGKGIMAVVMGLLVISFAIWGIGDIFRGFGSRTFATIGNTEIGIEQFRNYYNDKINQLSRAARRPITPDQARALGLDRQVLGELVAETTLDEKARQMKLGISNDEISGRITSDPNFQGVNGQFDRNRFQDLIRQAGYSEQRFVQEHMRVGKAWIITTPNRWFPVESHTSVLLKHWSRQWRSRRSEFTRLLSKREFVAQHPNDFRRRHLFPGVEIRLRKQGFKGRVPQWAHVGYVSLLDDDH